MNTSSPTSPPFIWPKNLDDIKITEEEKNALEENIKDLIGSFPNAVYNIAQKRSPLSPRRLYITDKHFLVILNNHGGMPNFKTSKKIKYVWDCREGTYWLKIPLSTAKQEEIIKVLKHAPSVGYSSMGLPELILDINKNGKVRYFERQRECFQNLHNETEVTIEAIAGLMDIVRKLHRTKYEHAKYFYSHSNHTSLDISHSLFHGNISPESVLFRLDSKNRIKRLMLTNFYYIGALTDLSWKKGWGSPETIQFAVTKTKYQQFDISEFLVKYGTKMDSWALGLLLASLVKGTVTRSLPTLSCILDKLKFDLNGNIVDDSDLANLTQQEIDTELEELTKNSTVSNALWDCIKRYLIVDPDEEAILMMLLLMYKKLNLPKK